MSYVHSLSSYDGGCQEKRNKNQLLYFISCSGSVERMMSIQRKARRKKRMKNNNNNILSRQLVLIFNKQLKWWDYIEVFLCYGKNRRKKDFFCLSIWCIRHNNDTQRVEKNEKFKKSWKKRIWKRYFFQQSIVIWMCSIRWNCTFIFNSIECEINTKKEHNMNRKPLTSRYTLLTLNH